jgi:hypothetical protein
VKTGLSRSTESIFIIFISFCLLAACGCETLRKKFIRVPKSERVNTEEVVYEPKEYPVQVMSNEDNYRLYYTFWRGWHQELIDALDEGQNHKKQIECINEIIKNLEKMKALLSPEKQAGLEEQLGTLSSIQKEIVEGGNNASNFYWMKMKLESAKSRITKDFAPAKVKADIIK